MRFQFSILVCCLTIVLSQAQSAKPVLASPQTASSATALIGAWQLVSVETVGPHGEVTYTYYGKHPEGLLIYDRSGWMSVQIVSDPKPAAPNIDSRAAILAATPEQKASALEGYYAYFGTWTVDGSDTTVTHHLKQSLYPGERGENFVRQFSFEGERLTLIAKVHEMGEDHQRRLVWERIRPAQ
jgi:Lipocalin-like domain